MTVLIEQAEGVTMPSYYHLEIASRDIPRERVARAAQEQRARMVQAATPGQRSWLRHAMRVLDAGLVRLAPSVHGITGEVAGQRGL